MQIPTASLCPELCRVLAHELAVGNTLRAGPTLWDWPEPGSVVAHLERELSMKLHELPIGLERSICNDPHYNWFNEVYCPIHKHLLTGGQAKTRGPMWVKL